MKKFLQYQTELIGTHENDLTEDFCKKLNTDYEKGIGIYNYLFSNINWSFNQRCLWAYKISLL